jgi:signal transduction histidine kinase
VKSGRLTLATVGVAVGLAAMLIPEAVVGREPDVRVLIVGLVLIACGLAIPAGDRARWCGALLVVAGFAWFLPSFDITGWEWADRAIASSSLLHIALVASAIVLVPVGAIRARGMAIALVPAYVAAVSAAVGGYRFALIAAGVALAVVVVIAWSRLRNRATGAALAFWAAGLVLGLELALSGLVRLTVASPPERTLSLVHEAALAVAAALVVTAVARYRDPDVVELREGGAAAIEPTIARALDDPSAIVRFPDLDGSWIDPLGRPSELPTGSRSEIRTGGEIIAVIGSSTPVPESLSGSLEDVLRLGRNNARLRRAVTLQLDELAGSRRRLLEANDSEREALERKLREGALAHLDEIETQLRSVPSLPGVSERAGRTRTELEHVATGLDPLARGASLADALRAVLAHNESQVELRVDETGLDEVTRRTLWYACAEGLSNAWKHAPGAHVLIVVDSADGKARATITDDGPGGADPRGSGLLGLADRTAALGGTLEIADRPAGGTVLRCVVPTSAATSQPVVLPRAVRDAATLAAV